MTRHQDLLSRALALAALLLTPPMPTQAAVNHGELHLAEFNCAACHPATTPVKARLAARSAPRLDAEGARVAAGWLHDFLARPESLRPGALMPDVLHGMTAAERAEAADTLTHYLISRQHAETAPAPAKYSMAIANAGRDLYHRVGCVACHAPLEPPAAREDDAGGRPDLIALARESLPLGDLARKFTVEELAAFLRNPLKSRPAGRMPSLSLTEVESRAVAMYLLKEQVPALAGPRQAGLNVEMFTGEFRKLPNFDKLPSGTRAVATSLALPTGPANISVALRFRTAITISKEGEYRFWTDSDDGSQLAVDGKLVVDNDGIHPRQEREGRTHLSAGEHSLMVTYFNNAGASGLSVSWSGPGFERQEIPSTLLSRTSDGEPMLPTDGTGLTVDATKAKRGEELYSALRCAACHRPDPPGPMSKPLTQLAGSTSGCLAPAPPAGAPRFLLTETQRREIAGALAKADGLSTPRTAKDQVAQTMATFKCTACHARDGQEGPERARRGYFVSSVNADLGDEGILPPHVNGVGAKLRPQWLERVLWQGASVRPYMATRMPQFGEANVRHLVTAFAQADEPGTVKEPPSEPMLGKHGQKLVGTGGLSCVSCHVFAGKASLGVPALDLTTVPERLRWDWFHRYLLDPPALRPGTRMPQFWPGGVAVNKDILGGDAEKQVAAIWWYLSDGRQASLPPGLVRASMELVADKEPIVYRHWIQGAGTKAIAVGYPEKVNIAFDANELRLALIWQGSFIDASRHRSGRGEGFGVPLGDNVRSLAPGAPLAVLDSAGTPWPSIQSRGNGKGKSEADPGRFLGYSYDTKRQPSFHYRYAGLEVEDAPAPASFPGNPDTGLRRTLSLRAASGLENVYFRAALGRVENRGGGSFLVDGKMLLSFPGSQPLVRGEGDRTELLVPIVLHGGQAKIVEEISW